MPEYILFSEGTTIPFVLASIAVESPLVFRWVDRFVNNSTIKPDAGEPYLDAIQWNADGLVPAIAQDAASGRILMMAWMNQGRE